MSGYISYFFCPDLTGNLHLQVILVVCTISLDLWILHPVICLLCPSMYVIVIPNSQRKLHEIISCLGEGKVLKLGSESRGGGGFRLNRGEERLKNRGFLKVGIPKSMGGFKFPKTIQKSQEIPGL